MDRHDMTFLAEDEGEFRSVGGKIRKQNSGWYCSCGMWYYAPIAMPNRLCGDNAVEARRAHRVHVIDSVGRIR